MNPYLYGRNNPLALTDPLGREPYRRHFFRDDAARDFNQYVRGAFDSTKEHGAVIRFEGGMYFYDTEISHGDEDDICVTWGVRGNESAVIHTHAQETEFSPLDINSTLNSEAKLDAYVGLPSGTLYELNYSTGGIQCK